VLNIITDCLSIQMGYKFNNETPPEKLVLLMEEGDAMIWLDPIRGWIARCIV
jgi:hypothetical protein